VKKEERILKDIKYSIYS